MILKSTIVSSLTEAGLWIDDMIYSFISLVYNLINKLAQIQIFDSATISGFSKRVYVLLGIFMLFKLSFSMITYLVNPDEFSDKSKGFGSLIKNVIISMVLMVATPYIFAEAFYVQKMILEDGTIIKLIYPPATDENGVSYSHVTDTVGDDIKFILFSQFVRPNNLISECSEFYLFDDDGKRVMNDEGRTLLTDTCKTKLAELFGGDSDDNYIYYVDGMEYESYELLTSEPTIYSETTKLVDAKGRTVKKSIITYHWVLSTIVGIVTLLILVTICLDVAVRTIKLGFYQLIAPIPIISNCDPKNKKDGMLQKWSKACVQTYLDLFIRLFGLFFGIYVVILLANSMYFDGIVSIILIIGALMFAKQLPKILQDLTGLKLDGKFTLNPFKKIKNEIPEGLSKGLEKARLRATGAAGGFLAGVIGGGNKFGQKVLSGAMGTVRGAVKGKGFAAGLSAQADSNRKMREARIAGATFWGGVGAAAGSVFGLDKAHLEKESKRIRSNEDAVKKAYREKIEPKKNNLTTAKTNIKDRAAKAKAAASRHKAVQESFSAMDKRAGDKIDQSEAGRLSTEHHAREINYQELIQNKQGTGVKYVNGQATYLKKGEAETEMFNKMVDNNLLSGAWTSKIDASTGLETIFGRDGQVVGTRYSSNSISQYKTKMDNDYQDAKFDYISACIASKKGEEEFIGVDGQKHSVAEVMGVKTNDDGTVKRDASGKVITNTDATIDGSYKELEVRLQNLGDSVQVTEYSYSVDATTGTVSETAGSVHDVEAEEGFDRALKSTGKALKAQFGQSKGVVKAIGNYTLNGDNAVQEIDDTIVHLEQTTEVEGLIDEHGHKISTKNADGTINEAATYSKAKDRNARDKAAQDARIGQSDVEHKAADAARITK